MAYSIPMDELAGLSESLRKLALDRFRLLKPHIEEGRPLQSVAAEAGIKFRTAQRWVTGIRNQWGARLTPRITRGRRPAGEYRSYVARPEPHLEPLGAGNS